MLIAWWVLRSTFWLFKADFLIHKASYPHAELRINVAASMSASFICLYPKIQTLKGCCESPFTSQFSHICHAVSHVTIWIFHMMMIFFIVTVNQAYMPNASSKGYCYKLMSVCLELIVVTLGFWWHFLIATNNHKTTSLIFAVDPHFPSLSFLSNNCWLHSFSDTVHRSVVVTSQTRSESMYKVIAPLYNKCCTTEKCRRKRMKNTKISWCGN